MEGEPVYMKVNPKIMRYVIKLFPDLMKYVEEDGCIYTVMLKAMYGCIQASSFWYRLLKKILEGLGYMMSKTNKCVFRKIVDGKIFVLLVYVDDILALVDWKEAEILRARLVERFGTVQFKVARKLSYLGMQIEVQEKGVVVDMSFYAMKILEDVEVSAAGSPGTKAMFIVKSKRNYWKKIAGDCSIPRRLSCCTWQKAS
jgi:hypothetical protein